MANSIQNGLEIRVTEMTKIEVRFGHLNNGENPRPYPCAIIDGNAFALQHEFREWVVMGTSSATSPETKRREGKDDPHAWSADMTLFGGALIKLDYEYDVSKHAIEKGTWYIKLGKQIGYLLK